MRINIIGFSSRGCDLAKRISEGLSGHECKYFGKTIGDEHGAEHVASLDTWIESSFRTCDAIIFIGAAGIAVRHIAPYLENKAVDPAVIVMDELGINIIPILSGHIGGANRLSMEIGKKIGGNVIITTATDLNDVFAADSFAVENDMHIENVRMVKHISSRLLDGKPVHLRSDVRIDGKPPNGLTFEDEGDVGIYITPYCSKDPFKKTLRLIPRMMTIGIGCHRDTDVTTIERFVLEVLKRNNISIKSIRAGGSIDLKGDEKGLLEFFDRYNIPVTFFSSEDLWNVKGEFASSDYVRSITGVDNVCERSAVAVSDNGEIVIGKSASNGVTVALAKETRTLTFGGTE